MLNRIVLMGRLTAVPELKATNTGKSVTSFRIAVDRNYAKEGEERKADFFNIVCWNNTAEFVCRYFTKGSLIALEGKLQSRIYQAKDGTNRYVTEVIADTVSFTGERREKNNSGNNYPAPPLPAQFEQLPMSAHNDFENMPLDDDLPF